MRVARLKFKLSVLEGAGENVRKKKREKKERGDKGAKSVLFFCSML